MKKAELVRDIIEVLNWVSKNRNYANKIAKVLTTIGKVNWYESNELMTRVLLRLNKDKLFTLHHDIIESIY